MIPHAQANPPAPVNNRFPIQWTPCEIRNLPNEDVLSAQGSSRSRYYADAAPSLQALYSIPINSTAVQSSAVQYRTVLNNLSQSSINQKPNRTQDMESRRPTSAATYQKAPDNRVFNLACKIYMNAYTSTYHTVTGCVFSSH